MPKTILFLVYLLVALISSNSLAAESPSYTIKFDQALSQVEVEINLSKPVSQLKARNSRETGFIQSARDCKSGEIISYIEQSLYPKPENRCIRYSMRLNQQQNHLAINAQHKSIVSVPSEWLFLPNLRSSEILKVNVITAKNHNLSVPWGKNADKPGQYLISASPQSADGVLVIGEFKQQFISHANTVLRVAYLPGKSIDHSKIEAWLRNTVDTINLTYGSFPHSNPQIIISPQGRALSRHKSPVPFARVVRDFGESVQFFIDQRQSLNQFKQDWTATHEFSHLMLPYVSWKNRWLSEGFASYYQNVLLARSGVYSEQRAWQKLYDGFMRGKRSAPELSPNSAAREGWGGNMKVYWSGAALFFVADQTLRRESNNSKSLDSTLKKLKACCLPAKKPWSGRQLMRKLDELSDSRVFTKLHTKYANSNKFVDFESEFANLGISVRNGKVKLSQTPEFIQLRKRIMTAP